MSEPDDREPYRSPMQNSYVELNERCRRFGLPPRFGGGMSVMDFHLAIADLALAAIDSVTQSRSGETK